MDSFKNCEIYIKDALNSFLFLSSNLKIIISLTLDAILPTIHNLVVVYIKGCQHEAIKDNAPEGTKTEASMELRGEYITVGLPRKFRHEIF